MSPVFGISLYVKFYVPEFPSGQGMRGALSDTAQHEQKVGPTVLQAQVSGDVIGRKGTLPENELRQRQDTA